MPLRSSFASAIYSYAFKVSANFEKAIKMVGSNVFSIVGFAGALSRKKR